MTFGLDPGLSKSTQLSKEFQLPLIEGKMVKNQDYILIYNSQMLYLSYQQ